MSDNIDYDRIVSYVYDIVEEIQTPVYDNQVTDEDWEDLYEDEEDE